VKKTLKKLKKKKKKRESEIGGLSLTSFKIKSSVSDQKIIRTEKKEKTILKVSFLC